MSFIENLLVLIGRICISGLFFWSAAERLTNWSATIAYMKSKKVPQVSIILPISIVIQILGALLVLLGYNVRFGALLLIILIVLSVLRFHKFWEIQGHERAIEKAFFMKDLAIVGGLLILLALGGGHFGFGH